MKLVISTAAALACLIPMAAAAQTAPAAAPAATTVAAAKFNLDTPVEVLAADEKARAVLEADLPELLPHPSYEMFKSMSLRALQPMSQGKLTDELMAKIETDLAAIK